MPIYAFKCEDHGSFDIWQKINDEHKSVCPQCHKKADRVFYPIPAHGDLPTKDPRPGKTRAELFDNLAKEGMGAKDWREADESTNKRFTDAGIKEKPFFGWTPELG